MQFSYILLLGFFFGMLLVAKACERSLEVRGVEDYCWTKNVEVVDRLQYTGKSFLNFAKKKLGMEIETDNEPQKLTLTHINLGTKCDYYTCIFQELKMLNGDQYPCYERITTWIKKNIIYNHAVTLLSRAEVCSGGLSKSIESKTFFSTDDLEETTTIADENEKTLELQSKCEIVAEYMKCMSVVEKSDECE